VTRRDRLGLCEAFHEFKDHTSKTLSETKLEAHERRADLAGLSLCDYLERAPRDLKVAQDKLRGEEETEH
jgi:hypothetical protein